MPAPSRAFLASVTIAREAWPFAIPFGATAAALLAVGLPYWALAALAAGVALLLFFRDPARRAEQPPGTLVAPAQGFVTLVDRVEDPELGSGGFRRVATFLSIFDVHVQRVPVDGEVVVSRARRGRKIAAFRGTADAVNEQHLTVLRLASGELVGVRQIAGLVARRVVCDLEEGMRVRRGQRLGIIKFGSRVDLLVPESFEVLVERGARLTDGLTPVARPATAESAAEARR